MDTSTHEPHALPPPPPPFFFATDLEDGESDVDLDEDDLDLPEPPSDDEDTRMEAFEFMGEGYRSLAHYFVSQLEDHVSEPVQWILTCLDMAQVQRRFEAGRYRYILEGSSVYRVGLKANPKPTPGEDPPGPYMPTRGV